MDIAAEDTHVNPLFRGFQAQLTFPDEAHVDAILASVLRELREGEGGGLGVYLDSQTPDGGSVWITGPTTPVDQSIAFLLGIFGVKVEEATQDQADRLSAALTGPTPKLWDRDAEPTIPGPVAVRRGAAASDPEVLSSETP